MNLIVSISFFLALILISFQMAVYSIFGVDFNFMNLIIPEAFVALRVIIFLMKRKSLLNRENIPSLNLLEKLLIGGIVCFMADSRSVV